MQHTTRQVMMQQLSSSIRLEADLLTLTEAEEGDIAKVTSNDEGNFSMFAPQSDGTWDEVIIERGTLKLTQVCMHSEVLTVTLKQQDLIMMVSTLERLTKCLQMRYV